MLSTVSGEWMLRIHNVEHLLLGSIPGLPWMVLLRSLILRLPWTGSAVLQTAHAIHFTVLVGSQLLQSWCAATCVHLKLPMSC